jgi:gluconolactonase
MYGYADPVIIKSEVFAVLPAELQKSSTHANPGAPVRPGGKGTSLEGPSFDRESNLYITDIPNGRIYRISPDRAVKLVAEYAGEPNGLKIHKDGRIFIADHHQGILILDPETGTVTPLIAGPEKEHFKGVNDLVFASNGDLYFTDQGATGLHDPTGRVFRMSPAGNLSLLLDTVPSPNGIVLDLSETGIFVGATRAAAVWYLPMSSTGMLVKVGVFSRLPSSGPDGMAIDVAGNVAVAHPGWGVVWLFDRRGLPIARVDSCAGARITNIAYGGPENRWLYMTEGDTFSVLRAEMPHPGKRMFSHT